jgi:hypothetical protein
MARDAYAWLINDLTCLSASAVPWLTELLSR